MRLLTVRLMIPSENAPICLTVTSESSTWQQDEAQTLGGSEGRGPPSSPGRAPPGGAAPSRSPPGSGGRRSPRRRPGVSASGCRRTGAGAARANGLRPAAVGGAWARRRYLDPGRGREDAVVGVLQVLLLEALRLGPHQQLEVRVQVAPQQRFAGGDVEQKGQSFHVEARLQDLQRERERDLSGDASRGRSKYRRPRPLTISPPWTPLPLRLGAYSARSTERSHSITRWLVHRQISAGPRLF